MLSKFNMFPGLGLRAPDRANEFIGRRIDRLDCLVSVWYVALERDAMMTKHPIK